MMASGTVRHAAVGGLLIGFLVGTGSSSTSRSDFGRGTRFQFQLSRLITSGAMIQPKVQNLFYGRAADAIAISYMSAFSSSGNCK